MSSIWSRSKSRLLGIRLADEHLFPVGRRALCSCDGKRLGSHKLAIQATYLFVTCEALLTE
jgi:hypothetical protein